MQLPPWRDVDLDVLTEPAELDLLRELSEFPDTVSAAAASLTPHRLAHYTESVGAAFHRFYNECRVIGDEVALTHARLWLSAAAKQVIGAALGLLGVHAPESMERLDQDGEG